MKNNTQPALKERIEKALEDFTKGRASMHVPPLDTDVDVVLAECSDRLSELKARCAALAAENAGLKSGILQASENMEAHHDDHGLFSYDADGEQMDALLRLCDAQDSIALLENAKTPATDAFLAEVRAQCLNAFIQHHSAELDAHIKNGGEQFDEKSVRIRDIIVSARLFREQIRKGAAL
ncbi:TPA: hNH endonuclease [Escherichia coli]|nr:hNH endonuclease [Escherichia coli]